MDLQTNWTTNQQTDWRRIDKQADKKIGREMKGQMDGLTD